MTYTAQEIANRNATLRYFNHAVRAWKQAPQEAWEDATNLDFGEYPATLAAARRAIAPWYYTTPKG